MNRDNEFIRHQKRSELNTLNVCKLVTWTKFSKAEPPLPVEGLPPCLDLPWNTKGQKGRQCSFSPVMEKGNPRKWLIKEGNKTGGREGVRERRRVGCSLWHDTAPRWPANHLLPSYGPWSPEHTYSSLFPGVEFVRLLLFICTIEIMFLVCFPQRYRAQAKGRRRGRGEQGTIWRKKGGVNIKSLWDLKEQINEILLSWTPASLLLSHVSGYCLPCCYHPAYGEISFFSVYSPIPNRWNFSFYKWTFFKGWQL